MTIETIIFVLTGVSLFLHLGIGIYVTNKTRQAAGIQEEIHKARTDIKERHVEIKEKYYEIIHACRQMLGYREDMNKIYHEIKKHNETTQKTSSCQYKYEYTNSTV
jgi:hypothetical protein